MGMIKEGKKRCVFRNVIKKNKQGVSPQSFKGINGRSWMDGHEWRIGRHGPILQPVLCFAILFLQTRAREKGT